MSLLINESFSINNSIAISNKIKNIPFFFLYFNPINSFKNLDQNRNVLPLSSSNIILSNIKFKLIQHYYSQSKPFVFNSNFSKSLYHSFISSYLLQQISVCYIISSTPFIDSDNLPLLNDFSFSLDLKKINYQNLKSYFSSDFLSNPFIPIDIFLISYLIHFKISKLDTETINLILDQYTSNREKIEIYSILPILQYFLNYDSLSIIKYLFQFKLTWSYYSLSFFFIQYYSDLLKEYKLYETLMTYIQCHPKERNKNIINTINNILFII